MEYRWLDRSSNAEEIVAKTEQFLRDRGFIISKEELENSVKLAAVSHRKKYDVSLVEVVISWSSKELSVRFEVGDRLKAISQFNPLISFLGGGSIVLKGLKTAEHYRKLEEDFWREIEEIVSA